MQKISRLTRLTFVNYYEDFWTFSFQLNVHYVINDGTNCDVLSLFYGVNDIKPRH